MLINHQLVYICYISRTT